MVGMQNYQKAICFLKRPHIAHRLREIYGRYSAIFSHHNLQKTPWSAQGQFDGRRLTPAQFGHDEDKSNWYGNSSSSSRLWPGGAALDGPRHSKVKFCTSVCKLWSSDLRRYQQWSIPHRAAPRAGFESGSASPFQVVRLPNCLHSSGSNFIFHFSTSS